MKKTCIRILAGLVLCVTIAVAAGAQPLATVEGSPAGVEWRPAVLDVGLVLTISGPDGFYSRQESAVGESPRFSVFDELGAIRPDGTYVWELRPVVRLGADVAAELSAARESGDAAVLSKAAQRVPEQGYATGSFSILKGEVFAGGVEEPASVAPQGENRLGTKVVLTNANGVIRNALCVGADCPDAPAFGDSSVLMMENNNRIKFGDTSASPFPNNDWEIEANSNVSGGQSYLGFNDCGTADNDGDCATDLVFAVEAGARASALYVESDGDVGLGTASPVLDLHIVTGNTPALRLEQDTSSGFAAQSWDVAGNETNFFVRDATSGSTLPFRIFPGNASNRLVISGGFVGVGTASPERPFDVVAAGAPDNTVLEIENNGAARLRIRNGSSGETWNIGHQLPSNTGLTFSDVGDADSELLLDVDGNLTITGTLTTGGGTCGGGGCDLVFDPETERTPLAEHAAAMWANGHLPAVGPTPENQPFNVTHKVGGMLHELEMAHIYIEQLDQARARLESELRREIADLQAELRALQEERE